MTPALTLADVDFLEKTFDVKPGARFWTCRAATDGTRSSWRAAAIA